MRDLAPRYAIDPEAAVERTGAHLAEGVAHPALVERIAGAYRGASDKPGGISLRRGIVALAVAGGAHPARELGPRRCEFRRNLRVLFPLAGTHDALGVLAQLRGEAVDAGRDAAEHRDIEIGRDHDAHQGHVLCEAAR